MKKLLPLFILLSLFLSACRLNTVDGSGNIVDNSRAVSGFSAVVFDVPGELTIVQGDQESIRVTGDDNLIDRVTAKVLGTTLYISLRPDDVWIAPTQPLRFVLNVKTLEQLSLNGSGDIKVDELKSNQFKLSVEGSGDVTLGKLTATTVDFDLNGSGDIDADAIRADGLSVKLNGSGDYKLKGKVNRQVAAIDGSGTYDARELESVTVEISINGSGDGMVKASETIRVSISGSGSLGYLGKAQIWQKISGSGSVYVLQ